MTSAPFYNPIISLTIRSDILIVPTNTLYIRKERIMYEKRATEINP